MELLITDGNVGSVVCTKQRQPECERVKALADIADAAGIADRLGHFLAAGITYKSVVSPHTSKHRVRWVALGGMQCTIAYTAGNTLRKLVLMMREEKIFPSSMYINRNAKCSMHHGTTLNVPARPSIAPRTAPRGLTSL